MNKHLMPNDGKHISKVLDNTTCKKHRADVGEPCFTLRSDTGIDRETLLGACGARILRAGYNGKISATSFQNKRPNGPSEGRKAHHKKKEAA